MADDPASGRRSFLKVATVAIGGAIGAVTAIPLVRYLLYPIGRRVVSSSDQPIDLIAEAQLVAGAAPIKVPIVAAGVRDGWATAASVAVGSAWLSKDAKGVVTAFSSVCPHLGCAVDFSAADDGFRCPCHKSAFSKDGAKLSGPAKRGMDPLPVVVEGGRVKVRFLRFRPDLAEREEA